MTVDVFHPCEWLDSVAAAAPFQPSKPSHLLDLPGYIALLGDGDNLTKIDSYAKLVPGMVLEFERARLSNRLVTRR